MISPKLALHVRRQCGLGGRARHLVVAQWKVLEDDFDLTGVFLDQLVEERVNPRTVRSLEIAKNHHSYCCSSASFEWGASQIYLDTLGK